MKKYALLSLLLTAQLSSAGLLPQQTTPSGLWDVKNPQPLPPMETALRRTVPGSLVYGLYTWSSEYMTFRTEINKVGWHSFRMGGPFDDSIMQALAEDRAVTMAVLGPQAFPGGKKTNRSNFESDEAFLKAYAGQVAVFADRYGPGGSFFADHPKLPNLPVKDIELWNEPNFQYLIPPDKRSTAEVEAAREALYAKMVPAVYAAVKPAHPDMNLVAFAAGGASAGDLRFVEHVHALNADVAKSYDTFSTHPYVQPAGPDANSVRSFGSYSAARSLSTLRETLAKYGRADVRVWYTELGWPISKEDGGTFAATKQDKNEWCVPPLFQAAYVCRTYALALRLNVDRVHIMYVDDADGFNGGFFANGTKEWRPSAHAVHTMITEMPNPKLTGSLCDGKDNCYIYMYLADEALGDTAANRVIMAWNVAGPKTVELNHLPPDVLITDMLGGEQQVTTENGTLSVEIGPFPVYIRQAGR